MGRGAFSSESKGLKQFEYDVAQNPTTMQCFIVLSCMANIILYKLNYLLLFTILFVYCCLPGGGLYVDTKCCGDQLSDCKVTLKYMLVL